VDPVPVIQGHDGRITVAFGDIRDDVLLEFEKRIYNNLKTDDNPIPLTVDDVVPGFFRETDYTQAEITAILGESFLTWVGWNKLDYKAQDYNPSNPFTYNYSAAGSKLDPVTDQVSNITEQKLLEPQHRKYDEKYWESRKMAPSCLIYYVGVKGIINNLLHHNLFFDANFAEHSHEIYTNPKWPNKPLFYVCCPSKTDDSVAPKGHENLFILIPVAPGLTDTDEIRDRYFKLVSDRLKEKTGFDINENKVYLKSYAPSNFVKDYNAFKGNAYGLANTLLQTAHLKPSLRSKKVKNLFYAGQLTVPGPGVPPALISGKLAAEQILNKFKF
jgi:hypothetical protein